MVEAKTISWLAWRRRGVLPTVALLTLGCTVPNDQEGTGEGTTLLPATPELATGDTILGTNWTEGDWEILRDKVRWAVAEGLHELPVGEALARLGATFVGTTYTPRTLGAPGPEHLVINLRELDCVTFIENLLALTWLVRNEGEVVLTDRGRALRAYEGYLRSVRYRGGVLDGYPSRLHYFSEWLQDNHDRGLVELKTETLGGITDGERIDFMSTHPEAYRQLADPGTLAAVKRTEERLDANAPHLFVPEARIAHVAGGVTDGDLIAATSTVQGLDVAHTGIALWREGKLHLLHAPLVGKSVEISEVSLAERIEGLSGQERHLWSRAHASGPEALGTWLGWKSVPAPPGRAEPVFQPTT